MGRYLHRGPEEKIQVIDLVQTTPAFRAQTHLGALGQSVGNRAQLQ